MGIESLEKLAKLKEEGAITQEEFDVQKKEILSNLMEEGTSKEFSVTQQGKNLQAVIAQQNPMSVVTIIGNIIRICFGIICLCSLFFIPTGIALLRNRPNTLLIFILNLFLGWTFIVWVIMLCWACSTDPAVRVDVKRVN